MKLSEKIDGLPLLGAVARSVPAHPMLVGYAGRMDEPSVLVRRLDPDMPMPAYAHPDDAGADLATAVDIELAPGERATVPTGISIALPEGYVGLVHPRSGLAARHGLSIVNAPGTIDAGYRGEIQVCLINLDRTRPIQLRRGDLIAQLVVQPVSHALFVPVGELPASQRGSGGYGSTGGVRAWSQPGTSAG